MSAHTPGPWEIADTTVYALTVNRRQNRFWLSVQSAGRLSEGEAGKEECEANARLIRAAPALADACKLALAYMEERGVYDTEERAAPIREALRLAGVEP